jgi:3-oxoadipate enol-lactonase
MPFFSFQDHSYYYEIHGQGTPLLLLNGIMMSTKSWQPFVGPLSQHHQLILLDLLDQGQSPRANQSYTQTYQVTIVAALLDHLHLTSVNLLGISYGGEVALQFATSMPHRVNKLMIFHSVMHTDERLKNLGRRWNEVAEKGDGAAYFQLTIPIIYSKTFQEKQADWLAKRKQMLLPIFHQPAFLQAMMRLTTSAESHDVRHHMHALTMPTLIVGATEDDLTPISYQEAMAHLIPHAHFIQMAKTGHASMYEQPELFTRLVIGFCLEMNTSFQI